MDGRRARSVLGVSEHAHPDEIRRAFRARTLATHPDRGGDRTEFELVVLAFETLQHVDVVPAPRRPTLGRGAPATPRYDLYDSPLSCRRRPTRRFDDALRAAIARLDVA